MATTTTTTQAPTQPTGAPQGGGCGGGCIAGIIIGFLFVLVLVVVIVVIIPCYWNKTRSKLLFSLIIIVWNFAITKQNRRYHRKKWSNKEL